MWSVLNKKVVDSKVEREREPRHACVLSLNEKLIITQTEKPTLLSRTEKQLRPGQQKYQVKQKQCSVDCGCRRLKEY